MLLQVGVQTRGLGVLFALQWCGIYGRQGAIRRLKEFNKIQDKSIVMQFASGKKIVKQGKWSTNQITLATSMWSRKYRTGSPLCLGRKVMRKTAQTQTSEEGEVLAAVEAWSWGVHIEATNIQIETSCNNLYRMINGAPNNISWQALARWDASKQTVIKANICDNIFFLSIVTKKANQATIDLGQMPKATATCEPYGPPPFFYFQNS
ncbi:hypothetical protein C5167_041933 [Papaver somniferum]|nr:hypothetical protein C5167_041933 [Papaver somniferum]